MKKYKIFPSVLLLIACIAVLGVGVFAIAPTQNTISGSITINSTNPEVLLTAYYNSVAEENKIGETQSARSGVNIDLTDNRMNFDVSGANTILDVQDKYVIIQVENTASYAQSVYFATSADAQPTETTEPITYSAKTSDNNIVNDVLKVSFSPYVKVEAGETVEVMLTFKLLKLYSEVTTINLNDNTIFLNISDQIKEDLFSSFTITEMAGSNEVASSVKIDNNSHVTTTFEVNQSQKIPFVYTGAKQVKIKLTDKSNSVLKVSFDTTGIVCLLSEKTFGLLSQLYGQDYAAMVELATIYNGDQSVTMDGQTFTNLGFYACNLDMAKYEAGQVVTYNQIEIPVNYVFPDGVGEVTLYLIAGHFSSADLEVTFKPEFATEYEEAIYELNQDGQSYSYYRYKNLITMTEEVIIPSTYNDKPVTSIGANAFLNCIKLKKVTMPETVKVIGKSAFVGCENLIEVKCDLSGDGYTLKDGTLTITTPFTTDTEPAWLKSNIRPLIISVEWAEQAKQGTTTIPKNAFDNCYNLASLEIPNGVMSIGTNAFYNCDLTAVKYETSDSGYTFKDGTLTITAPLTSNEKPAWYNETVNINPLILNVEWTEEAKKGTTIIPQYAFYNCYYLNSLEIPSNVKSVMPNSVWNSKNLSSIKFETSGEGYTFKDGTLTITAPLTSQDQAPWHLAGNVNPIILNVEWTEEAKQGTTTIPKQAFSNCNNLSSIEIPSGVKIICESAFNGCTILDSIEIPSGATNIDYTAFQNCYNLKYNIDSDLNYLGNSQNPYLYLVSVNNSSISSVNINKNCKIIHRYCFENRSSITQIKINAGLDLDAAHVLLSLSHPSGDSRYSFLGWYDNPNGTGAPISEISAEPYMQNVTLYPVWSLK